MIVSVHTYSVIIEFFTIGVSVILSDRSLHREHQKKNCQKLPPIGRHDIIRAWKPLPCYFVNIFVAEICPRLYLPQGTVSYSKVYPQIENQRHGLKATFSCEANLHYGSRRLQCNDDGMWAVVPVTTPVSTADAQESSQPDRKCVCM